MTGYFDTSALIKKYVVETGTEEVIRRWNTAIFTAGSSFLLTLSDMGMNMA